MRSVTLELIRLGNMVVNFRVGLGKRTENNNIALLTQYRDEAKINMYPAVTVQYNDFGKTPWEKAQTAFLIPTDFEIFIELLTTAYNMIVKEFKTLYKKDGNRMFISNDSFAVLSMSTKCRDTILIKPAILQYTETKMDVNFKPIEGIRMILNGRFTMDFTLSDMKILIKKLDKVDLIHYGLSVVNIYKDKETVQTAQPKARNASVFNSPVQENVMTSNVNSNSGEKTFDSFFGNK